MMMYNSETFLNKAFNDLFSEKEQAVIRELSEKLEITPLTVLLQALRSYQLAQSNLPELPKLAECDWASDPEHYCGLDCDAGQTEIQRLKEGDFTEAEFQVLCHCIPETDREAFFAGCADYQRKLFGVSDRDAMHRTAASCAVYLNEYRERMLQRVMEKMVEWHKSGLSERQLAAALILQELIKVE